MFGYFDLCALEPGLVYSSAAEGVLLRRASRGLGTRLGIRKAKFDAYYTARRNLAKVKFQNPESEAVHLVDAFNSLNRLAALHNISFSCPPLAQILINTYRAPIRMIIPGNGEIASTEGTTQGDPLAMAMYALAITPLIHQLGSSCPCVRQVRFADDATGASTCSNLKSWWNKLSSCGPAFGYHPNASNGC